MRLLQWAQVERGIVLRNGLRRSSPSGHRSILLWQPQLHLFCPGKGHRPPNSVVAVQHALWSPVKSSGGRLFRRRRRRRRRPDTEGVRRTRSPNRDPRSGMSLAASEVDIYKPPPSAPGFRLDLDASELPPSLLSSQLRSLRRLLSLSSCLLFSHVSHFSSALLHTLKAGLALLGGPAGGPAGY